MKRIQNFSAGPSILPVEVLAQVQEQLAEYQGLGMSLIEMSHRSKTVDGVHTAALTLLGELLGVPSTHQILFLGGGATLQFGMVPMNLLRAGSSADYSNTGAWAKKAIVDAKTVGTVNVTFDGKADNYSTLPDPAALRITPGAAYYHLTSNETIGGIQWPDFPSVGVPLVADMSSEILSRPIPFERFGLIYAGAQKNIGPAGLAVVIIRQDLLDACPENIPAYLSYKGHATENSMLNTPPVFQIWAVKLVLEWLKAKGGLAWAQQMAQKRSSLIYQAMDRHVGYYRCPVGAGVRSKMNVVWRLPSEALEEKFVKEAKSAGLDGLKGHRSVGGCRASLYNAMPLEGAQALAQFMDEFAGKNG